MEDLDNIPSEYKGKVFLSTPESSTLQVDTSTDMSITTTTTTSQSVTVWIVADEEFRNYYGPIWQDVAYQIIESSDDAFNRDHSINFQVAKYSEWSSPDDLYYSWDLMNSAQAHYGFDTDNQGYDMMAIFTNQETSDRGCAESLGDAWIAKTQYDASWNWHLAQHEASHNYGCPDHGYAGPTDCIMTYSTMMWVDTWCDDTCDTTIEDNSGHFS